MTHSLPGLEMPLTIEEMDGLDDSLAFKLFLDDVVDIAGKQKGKAKEGHLTDTEYSLALWEEELLAAKRNSEDRRMAHSMSNAIASDQNAIAMLRTSERIAESDRVMALSLGGTTPPPVSVDRNEREMSVGNVTNDHVVDTVSEVMSSLMGGLALASEDARSKRGEMSTSAPHPPTSPQCVSCLDWVPVSQIFVSPCGHVYCNGCVKQLFLNATKDEDLYPPRCCGNVIPAGIALRLLSYKELAAFSAKGVECTTVNRIYCADFTCSTFIPPWLINGEAANCPTCGKTTHTPCKSLEHPNQDCPSDQQLQQVLSLGESEGWRRCFNCRTMVELGQGCNHMTCRCGKHFCYVCGLEWKTCHCELWHENRLYGIANRVVEDEVHPDAEAAERHEAFARAVDGLLNHEVVGCQHGRRSQWKYLQRSEMQCEVCSHHLPQYIFECSACRMLACNRCIRNRLR